MVFSFFKKPGQKMPERPAARPRAPAVHLPEVRQPAPPVEEVVPLSEPLPDLEFTTSLVAPPKPAPVAVSKPAASPNAADLLSAKAEAAEFDMAAFDRDFTESSVMGIDVEHDVDPLQSDIEQAVVLFANGQDGAARALLETFIRSYPGREGLRFWLLLFDLLQVTGDRAAFEQLGVEFAENCETSPPTWRHQQPAKATNQPGPKLISLQGVLTADCQQPLAELAQLIGQKLPAQVDCGKLIGCDDDVAEQFATLLSKARKTGVAIALDRPEAFLGRLNERLVAGEPGHAQSWLLLLELLQRHGTQEAFEERAVDYAVTFEHSPPSWEGGQPTAGARPATPQAKGDDAYHLSGELKSCRFDELVDVLDAREVPILDFSGVRRMDFFSAGQLVNRLSPYKAAGREVVIRSPNHLVAELMAVVGLNKQARIVVPKS